jgi:hypothetical protein
VKTSGLRWLCLAVMLPIPFANRPPPPAFAGAGCGSPSCLPDHATAPGCQSVRTSPQTPTKQRGRPAKKGNPRPKLSAVLADPATVWTQITMAEWYGGQTRTLEYVSATSVWYTSGLPPAPIRWVLVRDPSGVRDPQAFLCTDLDLDPVAIPRVKPGGRLSAASCSAGGSRPPSRKSAST